MKEFMFKLYSKSYIGNRVTNQDSLFSLSFSRGSKSYTLLAVADGVGGLKAGDRASSIAINCIANADWQNASLSIQTTVSSTIETAQEMLALESKRLFGRAQQMATTLAVCIVSDTDGIFSSLGDSRIYLLQKEGGYLKLEQITKDDTEYEDLKETGVPEALIPTSATHTITRSIGGHKGVRPKIREFDTKNVQAVLVCSDGLNHIVNHAELKDMMAIADSSPYGFFRRLEDYARFRAAPDNYSAVLAVRP